VSCPHRCGRLSAASAPLPLARERLRLQQFACAPVGHLQPGVDEAVTPGGGVPEVRAVPAAQPASRPSMKAASYEEGLPMPSTNRNCEMNCSRWSSPRNDQTE